MAIKFNKIARACVHNENIIAGKSDDRMIYDYAVIDNGEFTAVFQSLLHERGYVLADREGMEIDRPGMTFFRTFIAKTIADMPATYERAKDQNLVPTAEQIAQRKLDEESQAERQRAEAAEYRRIRMIEQAGPDLLAAIKPFAALLQSHHDELPDDRVLYAVDTAQVTIGDLRAAVAAINKAENIK